MRRYYRRKKTDISFYLLIALLIFGGVFLKNEHQNIFLKDSSDTLMMGLLLIIVLAILGTIFKLLANSIRRNQYLRKTHSQMDRMDGEEFEQFLKAHFEKQGYSVKTTPKSNDYGADLICQKGGIKMAVQAKRYKGKVGIAAVQQILGGMNHYSCNVGMVATNSYFSSNAWVLAKKSNVTLWDRNKITEIFDIKVDKA